MLQALGKWIGIGLCFGIFGLCVGLGLRWGGGSGPAPAADDFSLSSNAWAQGDPAMAPAPGSASPRHTIVVDVAQRVSPGVVSIGVTKTAYVRQHDPFGDPFFTPYIIAPMKRDLPYLGSGFIIDQQGHVITNYHVIEEASSISVTLTDGRTFPAKLLDADRYVDVALLEMQNLKEGEQLPTIALGDSDQIMIGETVLAVGNPFGPLIADPRPSVSVGVISALGRSFKADQHDRIYHDMIQTDAAINPGNSGGPLVNLDGQVIGINTFIFSNSGGSDSVGFSIPINRVRRVVDEIIRYGKVRAIRMDFELRELTPYVMQVLGITTRTGALVWSVDIGGSAQQAGLEPGDVVVAVDDKKIQTSKDLIAHFLTRTVDETIKLTVVRQDQQVVLDYVIREGRDR